MTILNGGGSSGVSPKNFNQGIEDVKSAVQDVQTSVNSLSSTMQSGMSNLQDSVEESLGDVQTAVQNAPAGPFPFVMNKFQVNSVDEGIKITYKANNSASITSGNDKENAVGSIEPRGVMIRYSDDHYPATPTDGLLAVDDTDIVDDASATGNTKEKTYTLTGLTNNQLYYFSAFPYSYSGVFNTNCGFSGDTSRHRKTCSYTGNKGTLTVDVTQDYDYKTLGEFTATLTPSSGSAKTQTRTGPGQVVFAGLDAGEYTLSFSTETYFTTPASQQITITAGQPNTTSAEYKFSASFSQCTWAEIKQIADDGRCKSYFSLGDKKSVSIQYISTPEDGYTTQPTLSKVTTNLVIVDFDAMDKENGGKANLQLCTEDVVTAFSSKYTVDNRNGYWLGAWCSPEESKTDIDYPYMRKYIEGKISNILPDEILNVVTPVKVSAKYWRRAGGTSSTPDGMTTGSVVSKLFPPPKEFSHWSTNTKRIKKDAKTKAVVTWQTCDGTNYVNVYDFQYKSYNSNGALSGDSNYSGGMNNVIRHPMCVCI